MFLVPFATPVNASNASPATLTVTTNSIVKGGSAGNVVNLKLYNPASNAYSITGFVVNAPSGWTVTGASASTFFTNSVLFSSSSVSWTCPTPQNCGVPPGSTAIMSYTLTAPTGVYPFSSTFTSLIQDASSFPAYYSGPSFKIQVMDPTSAVAITVTPGGSNTLTSYTAGTAPYTITAAVTCTVSAGCPSGTEAGLPIVWSASYTPTTASYSFSPTSGTTSSSGSSSTTFQPSNTATDQGTVTATIGSSSVASTPSTAITTIPGSPTKVSFRLGASAFPSTHYLEGAGSYGTPSTSTGNWAMIAANQIHVSAADSFSNAVPFGSVTSVAITITAISGGGLFDAGAGNHPAAITCTSPAGAVSCTTGYVTLPYFQSGNYGIIGTLSATITGTYASHAISLTGTSGTIVTSTFASASPIPGVPVASSNTVLAGKTATVTANLTVAQKYVPITFYLDAANSYETSAGAADYGSNSMLSTVFTGGTALITVTSNSLGNAQVSFTVDTVAGSVAQFMTNVTAPIDGSPTNALGVSGDSATVTTVPGSISSLAISTYFYALATVPPAVFSGPTSHSVPSGTLYTDIGLADKYGNPVTLAPNANTIQVTLVSSAGTLSATSVYVTAGSQSTGKSFGAVVWTMPSSIGTVKLTATAVVTGLAVTASKSITIVSKLPASLFINSPTPLSGVIYSSSTNVVFGGNASISKGYPSTGSAADSITSVCFTVKSGTNGCAVITSAATVTWSTAVSFAPGLYTVTFNATDANSNTLVSSPYKVLVDTAKPTVKFTTSDKANITSGATVKATIVVAQGDLNSTSVVATLNGTALASSHVAITGTNTLGSSVTYTVTISGLTAGTDSLGLSASSLAGLTGTATAITVKVTVAFAASITINSATYGTLGAYTGISVSATNAWSSSQNLVIFAVWKNSAGQTVAVSTGGLTLASGATSTAFAPLVSPLPSGTYTVNVFVITTSNNPVSSTTTTSVSL